MLGTFFAPLLLICAAIAATAGQPARAAVHLFVWKPFPNAAGIILPVRDGESPQNAATRYVEAITNDGDYSNLADKAALKRLPIKNFKPLAHGDFSRRILVIANSPKQAIPVAPGTVEILSPFFQNGGVPYLLPPAVNVRMEDFTDDIIDQLDTYFPSFFANGGPDLDRRVWREKNELCQNANYCRDLFEVALIRKKIETIMKKSKAWVPERSGILIREDRLSAFCRGAQLTAKEMGHHIGNDIKCEIPWAIEHGTGQEGSRVNDDRSDPNHPADILKTSKSVLKGFLNGADRVTINSYHHQYIVIVKSARYPLELAAFSSRDGVIEGLESPNGAILLLQFHPEYMLDQPIGRLLMARLTEFLTPMSCFARVLN